MTRVRPMPGILVALLAAALLLSACGGAPAASTPTMEPLPADVLIRALAAYQGPVGVLRASGDTLTASLTAAGTTQAVAITGGSPACPGWVNTTPDYVFRVTAALSSLEIAFDGATLGSLLVVTPRGNEILCTDNMTSRPTLTIAQPAQGVYGVVVGRGNLASANAGELTVTGQ